MKKRIRYEIPVLMDLTAETASGAVCGSGTYQDTCATGIGENGSCTDGSCIPASQCAGGTAASYCGTGTRACGRSVCFGCCLTGNTVEGGYQCNCNGGGLASWACTSGGNAAQSCNATGSYDNFAC